MEPRPDVDRHAFAPAMPNGRWRMYGGKNPKKGRERMPSGERKHGFDAKAGVA